MKRNRATRSRCFSLILYPDCETHMKTLDYIVEKFNYVFILHDQDIFLKDVYDDSGKKIIHKAGEKKKSHFHVLIDFPNPRSINTILDLFPDIGYLETCNFFTSVRYLIHEDDPNKYQYNSSLIETNMLERVTNIIGREYKREDEETRRLYNYLASRNFNISFKELTDFALENGLLLELKRNVYFYRSLCIF